MGIVLFGAQLLYGMDYIADRLFANYGTTLEHTNCRIIK